jgi:hypothetical protein
LRLSFLQGLFFVVVGYYVLVAGDFIFTVEVLASLVGDLGLLHVTSENVLAEMDYIFNVGVSTSLTRDLGISLVPSE